jgi:hypothetical protein
MVRDEKARQDNANRQKRYYDRHKPNANLTADLTATSQTSSSSSSISSSSSEEKKDTDRSIAEAPDPACIEDSVTIEKLKESWNDLAAQVGLATVMKLSQERRRKLAARIREHPDEAFWAQVFTNIALSPFLLGTAPSNGHPKWRVDFDFLITNETHLLNIYEGGYNTNYTTKVAASPPGEFAPREPDDFTPAPLPPPVPLSPDDLRERWNVTANRFGLVPVERLTPEQEALCVERVAEHPDRPFWDRAFSKLAKTGKSRLAGRSFDWLIGTEWKDERVFELYKNEIARAG